MIGQQYISCDIVKKTPPIKVLIAEHTNKAHAYTLHSPSPLTIYNDQGASYTQPANNPLALRIKNNKSVVYLSGKKKCKVKGDRIMIDNDAHHFILNDKEYRGTIIIHTDHDKHRTYIINELPLEDYVCSVLRSECIPYWPLEIQKVQAIASRSYAAYHIYLNRHQIRPYDIRNCTLNQIYDGHHTMQRLHQAVAETEHIIMVYDNKPVLAMFDVCCGGVIPADLSYIDERKPYLYRPYQCTYCAETSSYRWSINLHTHDFLTSLRSIKSVKKKLAFMGGLRSVEYINHDPSGVVTTIKLHGSLNNVELEPRDIKQAFNGKIKSPAFSITKHHDAIAIEGKGFGHYHGLCQCGARELVKRGWHVKRILRFYYPDIAFAKLRG
jgi:stage II sporulation protein D